MSCLTGDVIKWTLFFSIIPFQCFEQVSLEKLTSKSRPQHWSWWTSGCIGVGVPTESWGPVDRVNEDRELSGETGRGLHTPTLRLCELGVVLKGSSQHVWVCLGGSKDRRDGPPGWVKSLAMCTERLQAWAPVLLPQGRATGPALIGSEGLQRLLS